MSYQNNTTDQHVVRGVFDELAIQKNKMSSKLKKFLTDNNECYVLITCGKPSKEGKMHVEMTYEGDESLAAYLIESACGRLDEQHVLNPLI